MEDLMGKLGEMLNTPEGQAQLNNIKNLLASKQASSNPSASPQNGFDLSSLASMFSSMQGQAAGQSQANTDTGAQNPNGGFDLSALSSMLSSMNAPGQAAAPPQGGGGFDLSALSSLLGGGGGGAAPSFPPVDINTILKLQQVFATMNKNDKNTSLLTALKPHFSETRQAKVDQAISILRLLNMMPMIKESGIFSGL